MEVSGRAGSNGYNNRSPTAEEGKEIEENNGCVAINITGSCFGGWRVMHSVFRRSLLGLIYVHEACNLYLLKTTALRNSRFMDIPQLSHFNNSDLFQS